VTDEIIQELVERIHQELGQVPQVLVRMNEGWELFHRSNDDHFLDGVPSNLHGYYLDIERILTQIAETLDGNLPRGENWPVLLLQQMMTQVPRVRPASREISEEEGGTIVGHHNS
jgi:hypothetical protein